MLLNTHLMPDSTLAFTDKEIVTDMTLKSHLNTTVLKLNIIRFCKKKEVNFHLTVSNRKNS